MNDNKQNNRFKKKIRNQLNKRIAQFQEPLTRPEKWLYTHGMLSKTNLSLPDFLGIGAQKSGTSWLYYNLRCHPELYLAEPKELHYFDWNFHKSLRFYSNKFKPGDQKVKGEITPGYSIISPNRIKFIHKLKPDLKLIFLMRNPIDRAWSHALMNLVEMPNIKFKDIEDSNFYAHFKAERSTKRGDYLTILKNWLTYFPSDQLYIGFFEDIKDHPQELLIKIFTHLGVSKDVNWDFFPYREVIKKNPKIPMPEKYRHFLEDMYRRDIEILYERFRFPVEGWRC